MKVCTKCKIDKSESEFGRHKSSKSGIRPTCKDCTNADNATRRNPEYHKSYDRENSEKIKIVKKKWEIENKERIKAGKIKWAKENPEKVKEYRKKTEAKSKEKRYNYHKKRNREIVETASDAYIKSLALHHRKGYSKEMIEQYPALLELIRLDLLTKRTIKNLRNDNKN